jgi:hypothetical protein
MRFQRRCWVLGVRCEVFSDGGRICCRRPSCVFRQNLGHISAELHWSALLLRQFGQAVLKCINHQLEAIRDAEFGED